jgi:hypothetical protein
VCVHAYVVSVLTDGGGQRDFFTPQFFLLAGPPAAQAEHLGEFAALQAAADALPAGDKLHEALDVVEKDLDRTFPHHDMFAARDGPGQRDLRAVLRAYAMHNPTVGYCQGMGMLAGALLMQVAAFYGPPCHPPLFCIIFDFLLL